MNIIICIKQVPKTEDIKLKAGEPFSPEGLSRRINIFDAFSIEEALRIKDRAPDTNIILLTLGDELAERSLIEGLSLGADKAYRITDPGYVCDTLSTARLLSQAIRHIEKSEGPASIVFTGTQSTDSGNGIIPLMLSHLLGRPLLKSVTDIRDISENGILKASIRGRDSFSEEEGNLPLIISMTKSDREVRFPTFKRIRGANRMPITRLDSSVTEYFEPKTSVTGVIKPGRKSRNSIVNPEDDEEGARLLMDMLKEDNIFKR